MLVLVQPVHALHVQISSCSLCNSCIHCAAAPCYCLATIALTLSRNEHAVHSALQWSLCTAVITGCCIGRAIVYGYVGGKLFSGKRNWQAQVNCWTTCSAASLGPAADLPQLLPDSRGISQAPCILTLSTPSWASPDAVQVYLPSHSLCVLKQTPMLRSSAARRSYRGIPCHKHSSRADAFSAQCHAAVSQCRNAVQACLASELMPCRPSIWWMSWVGGALGRHRQQCTWTRALLYMPLCGSELASTTEAATWRAMLLWSWTRAVSVALSCRKARLKPCPALRTTACLLDPCPCHRNAKTGERVRHGCCM